jgi:hypothetical protein
VRFAAITLAPKLGTYPSSEIARSTLSRVFLFTFSGVFMNRDTVAVETPDRRATSTRVAMFFWFIQAKTLISIQII